MDESERLQRYRRVPNDKDDKELADNIAMLLDHPRIDETCLVDAYYYDYSVIPDPIIKKYGFYRDVYLIFGITLDGELVSKWVDRFD